MIIGVEGHVLLKFEPLYLIIFVIKDFFGQQLILYCYSETLNLAGRFAKYK